MKPWRNPRTKALRNSSSREEMLSESVAVKTLARRDDAEVGDTRIGVTGIPLCLDIASPPPRPRPPLQRAARPTDAVELMVAGSPELRCQNFGQVVAQRNEFIRGVTGLFDVALETHESGLTLVVMDAEALLPGANGDPPP